MATTMQALILNCVGDPTDPGTLSVSTIPVPDPRAGEVRIRVHAAAVNPVDYKLIRGDMPGKKPGARVGFDVSGVVDKIGPNCASSLKEGDEVYADVAKTQGAFAEYVNAQEKCVALKPGPLSFREAAALPLAGLTAYQALTTQGGLASGGRVAILGGSGGVGSLAIQMAKALGAAHVMTTSTNEAFVKDLGADVAINYRTQDVAEALRGQDLDLVFDCVGGYESWVAAQAGLKARGSTFVTIVGDSPKPGIGMVPGVVNRKLWSLFGYASYKIFLTDTAGTVAADMAAMTAMVEGGRLKPLLDERRFTLTDDSVRELMAAIMSSRTKGKLVMDVVH